MQNWEGFCKPPGVTFSAMNEDRQTNRGSGSQGLHLLVRPVYPSIGLRLCPWRRNHPRPSTMRDKRMHPTSFILGLFHLHFGVCFCRKPSMLRAPPALRMCVHKHAATISQRARKNRPSRKPASASRVIAGFLPAYL